MRKLTFLFALLCVSVMGWAYDENASFPDVGPYANQFSWSSIGGVTAPMGVNSVESKNGFDCIYVNVGQADFDPSTGIVGCELAGYVGAGVWIKINSLILEDNEIYFKNSGGTTLRGLIIHNSAAGAASFDPASIDWSSVPYITGQEQFKIYFTEENRPSNWEGINIQTAPWAQNNTGIYVSFPDGVSACSLGDRVGCWIEGAQVLMYLSAFSKQVTEVTINHASGTKTLYIYNKDGEPDDLTGWNIAKGKTSTAGFNAEAGHAGANDGNFNSRWSSNGGIHYPAAGAQDWWYVDLGDFYRVDQIKILFEGAAPTDYDLLISNNAVSWTVIGTYSGTPNIGNNPETDYNEYDFTDKIGRYVKIFARAAVQGDFAYGISIWEFEVYGDHASIVDVNPPVMGAAGLSGDPIYNQVNIAVTATDAEDGTVGKFHVVDASKSVDQVCTAAAGVIAVVGLEEKTSYSFTITALDAAGNESENDAVVAATTPADPTMPTTAAPVPSGANKDILPVYSDAFTSILEHGFSKNGFDGPAILYKEANISGDHFLVYDLSSGPKFVIWGMWNDEGDAIIAQSAYRAEGKMGIDASEMEYMHVDIWSLQPCSAIWVNVNDEGPGALRLSHAGNGWQGFDIALSDITVSGDENKRINNVRWLKFRDFGSVTGKLAFDNVYFWKTSTGLKSVSATPNNAEYGSASVVVKSNGLAPEGGTVVDGTEVTFSATPKDGYVFVNWSNDETRATFDAVVNSAMNLTANFRALGTTYCNTLLHSSNGGQEHDAYVTMKRSGENEYQLIVRTTEALSNFGGTNFYKPNNVHVIDIRNQGVLSNNNHTLTVTFSCDKEPYMTSPLYVVLQGGFEAHFPQLTNIEFSQPCADPEITAIELNKTEATLEMGNTLTLVPTFTPAYMSADITWQTSDADVATVDNGVVTPVAAGNVTITAKVTEDIKATCTITVQASQSHNWYGYATDKDLDYTYRIEYTTDHHIVAHVKRQGDKIGLVTPFMNINNQLTDINVTDGEETGWWKGTTAATFTTGDNIHILIQSNFAGASSIIEFDYEVGSDNVMPTIIPSTLALNNNSVTLSLTDADLQLTAEIHHRDAANQTIIWTSDDESVATVANGQVHPFGVGTTTIHATTHNGISASCEVTVVTEIEEANYYGSKTITVKGNPVGVNYSVTRNADHTLTYYLSVSEAVEGLVMQINDGDYHDMESIVTGREAQWTSTKTYSDGTVHNFFFYLPNANGAGRIDVSYTVGGASEESNVMIALNDGMANNPDKIAEYDGQIADVVFSREFEDDGFWYTLCLPFDMSAAQLTEAFGAGYTLATLTGSEDRGSILHLNFNYVNTLEAGKPYMFRPGIAVTKENIPTINAVTINNTYVHSVSDHMTFQGTFTNMTLEDENQRFVGPENYLYEPADNGTEIDAFRCYFTIVEGAPGLAPGKRARIVFGEQTATGLDNTTVQHPDAAKLMLDGVLYIIREGRTYNAQGILVK